MEIAQIVKDFCCVCLKGRFDKEGNQISPPWDDPQDVVYTDENGNGYCLFHAPAEHKYKEFGSTEKFPVDEFCNLVRERIFNTPNLKGKRTECNLSGTVFPVDINFEGYEFPAINFSYSTFKGTQDLTAAPLRGMQIFLIAPFGGTHGFLAAPFRGAQDLGAASFRGTQGLRAAPFRGMQRFFNPLLPTQSKACYPKIVWGVLN